MKHITLESILTPSEIERARKLCLGYRLCPECAQGKTLNALIVADIVAPNMARINAATGQENDARFIGYAIEYCLLHERLAGKHRKANKRQDSPWKD